MSIKMSQSSQPEYVGCVLATGELNYYDDSDFYAVVWDEKTSGFKRVIYASTRYWSYDASAEVDATPAVLAKARIQAKKILFEDHRKLLMHQAMTLEKNKTVVIVSGKQGKNQSGMLFYIGPEQCANRHRKWRKVGIAMSDRKDDNGLYKDVIWTYDYNVEVLNPERYITASEEESRQYIDSLNIDTMWRSICNTISPTGCVML